MFVGAVFMLMRWGVMTPVTWGVGSIAWIIWGALQCALAPAHAFILLSSYPAHSRQFELGTLYKYVYETSVLLNEPQAAPVSSQKDVGFRLQMNIDVAPVWSNPKDGGDQLLQINLVTPRLAVKARQGPTPEGFVEKHSRINNYASYPLLLHWIHGSIKQVYVVEDEQLTMVNLKKGIASLLQYDVKNIKKQEVDGSGNCEVTYKVIDKDQILKTKNNCKTVGEQIYYNHTNKVLSANIKSHASVSYEFSKAEKVINLAVGVETHFLRIEARLETGSEVMSRQKLQLKGSSRNSSPKYSEKSLKDAIKAISKKIRKKIVGESLSTIPDPKECIACKSLQELITNFKNALNGKNLASQSSAIAFIRILHKIRESDQNTIQKILKNKQFAKILPQILDITAAAQTVPSHKASMSVLNFQSMNIELPERYLLALSLSTHPSDLVIQDLIRIIKSKKIKDEKLGETLLLTAASLSHTYTISSTKNNKAVQEVGQYINQEINKCKEESCKLIHIRALKNLRDKKYVSTLLMFVRGKERKPAIYAMRALQTMPFQFINSKVCQQLEKVYLELDRPHDSTVKSLAANVLLQHDPSEEFLWKVFENLATTGEKEFNTLVLSQIRDIVATNENTRKIVDKILKSPRYGNYHILGQNGLSTAFSRTIAKDRDSNSSFTNILEIKGGLLKRSTVDVFVNSIDSKMRLLSFEIFAGGLNMFGSSDSTEEDTEEANAGIEITLMNTQLRPYVFFTGQGELMGHVWSGTGSERTTALQGSVLLQDHNEYIPLQNGFSAEMLLTGVISYDFAGQVEISLWNRNAHSLVEVAAAIVVQGQARIDNSIVQTMIEFNSGAQSQLNFVSDLDFSDDITMCLQMIQPDFEIIENVRKLEKIPGSKYALRKYKRKVIPSAGKTYVMNKKNTDLCNKMFR